MKLDLVLNVYTFKYRDVVCACKESNLINLLAFIPIWNGTKSYVTEIIKLQKQNRH